MKGMENFKIKTIDVPCDFCGSTQFTNFNDRMRYGVNLKTVVCTRCSLVQTNPQPTKDTLSDFYTNFYHLFHQRIGVDEKYVDKSKRMAKRRFELITKFVSAQQDIKGLEIGTGAAQFLMKVGNDSSWEMEGIELGKESFDYSKSLGLVVENVGIEDFKPKHNFDLIASFHVMEHVRSPKDFLKRCSELLNPGGWLYLEVPNLDRPGGVYETFLQFPHLYSFNHITVRNYIESAGYNPIFIDDSVFNLTIICRKMRSTQSFDNDRFVKTDIKKFLLDVKRKNRIYTAAKYVPSLSILRRIKALMNRSY